MSLALRPDRPGPPGVADPAAAAFDWLRARFGTGLTQLQHYRDTITCRKEVSKNHKDTHKSFFFFAERKT